MSEIARGLQEETREKLDIMPIPAPGIYPGIAANVYHSWDCASASRLKQLRKSPAHLRYYLDHPKETDTPTLAFGRAYHDAILQPEVLHRDYLMAGPCVAELKTGERKGQSCGLPGIEPDWSDWDKWYCGRHAKKVIEPEGVPRILSAHEYAEIRAIRDKVLAHPIASELLTCRGVCETSIVWQDRDTEVLCKGRVDRYCTFRGWKVHVDLKGTTDASPDGFCREIYQYGYHIQAAMYLDGANAIVRADRRYAFIAVEKSPPYVVGIYELDAGAIAHGRAEYKRLLHVLRECQEKDRWPDYTTDEILRVSLPKWATQIPYRQ